MSALNKLSKLFSVLTSLISNDFALGKKVLDKKRICFDFVGDIPVSIGTKGYHFNAKNGVHCLMAIFATKLGML